MDTSLFYLVKLLLVRNKITFDNEELQLQIQSHPSYPSLHAITGVLDHFYVDNLALDVPVDKVTLSQLPKTFLAQLKTEEGEAFAIVTNEGLDYEVIASKKEKKIFSINDFLKAFTGIIVAVEKTEDTIVPKREDKSVFSIVSFISLILAGALLFNSGIDLVSSLFLLVSFLGIYISYALVKQELGESTLLGNAFCPSTSTQSNCNKVLTSKGAQFGNFKLSDLSMSYFIGTTLAAFLIGFNGSNIVLLYAIGMLAVPITIYSIYYQYAVVKQWCLLCLSIIGVLWVQAAFSLLTISSITWYLSNGNLNSLFIITLSFLSAFVIWNSYSSKNKQIKELTTSKIKYFKFKRDYKLFESLLNVSKTVNTHIPNTSEIVLGNKASSLDITIVTSPFCGHCKSVHTLVEDILKKYADSVKLTIRFNANASNAALVAITSRLLELYHTQGEIKCLEAMHDIYGNLATEKWTSKWGITANRDVYHQTLENEYQWCIANAVNFTPELLINGKSYPKAYDREDLIFFIEELEENCCINSGNTIENVEVTAQL